MIFKKFRIPKILNKSGFFREFPKFLRSKKQLGGCCDKHAGVNQQVVDVDHRQQERRFASERVLAQPAAKVRQQSPAHSSLRGE